MDKDKLEAALRRLEDEQFGRTFNLPPGTDAAVIGVDAVDVGHSRD
jgi:hypothetical protein